jgi:hypothetical protein
MPENKKKSILIIGGGSVGAIAALNLEAGGVATVTAVLRSNYDAVTKKGFDIHSCDHGKILNWKPSHSKQSSMASCPAHQGRSASTNTGTQSATPYPTYSRKIYRLTISSF